MRTRSIVWVCLAAVFAVVGTLHYAFYRSSSSRFQGIVLKSETSGGGTSPSGSLQQAPLEEFSLDPDKLLPQEQQVVLNTLEIATPSGSCNRWEQLHLLWDGLAVRNSERARFSSLSGYAYGSRSGGADVFKPYNYDLGGTELFQKGGAGCISKIATYLHRRRFDPSLFEQLLDDIYIHMRFDGLLTVNASLRMLQMGMVPTLSGSLSLLNMSGEFISYKPFCWQTSAIVTMFSVSHQGPFDLTCFLNGTPCPLIAKFNFLVEGTSGQTALKRFAEILDSTPRWPNPFAMHVDTFGRSKHMNATCPRVGSVVTIRKTVNLHHGDLENIFQQKGAGVVWAILFNVTLLSTCSDLHLSVRVDGLTTFDNAPFDLIFGGCRKIPGKFKTFDPASGPSAGRPYAAVCSAELCHFGLPMPFERNITIAVRATRQSGAGKMEAIVTFGAKPHVIGSTSKTSPKQSVAHLYAYHSTSKVGKHGNICKEMRHKILNVSEGRWGAYVGVSLRVNLLGPAGSKEGDHHLTWDGSPGPRYISSGLEDLFTQYWNFHAPGADPHKRLTPFFGTYWQQSTTLVHSYIHYLTNPFFFESDFSHYWLTDENGRPSKKDCTSKGRGYVQSLAFYYLGASAGWVRTSSIALENIQRDPSSSFKFNFDGRYPHTGNLDQDQQRIRVQMLEMAANSSHGFDVSIHADNKGLVIRRFYDRSVSLRHLSSRKIGQWALESVSVAIEGVRVGMWTPELMPHRTQNYAVSDYRIPRVACGSLLREKRSNQEPSCQIAIRLSTTDSSIWSTAGYDIFSVL